MNRHTRLHRVGQRRCHRSTTRPLAVVDNLRGSGRRQVIRLTRLHQAAHRPVSGRRLDTQRIRSRLVDNRRTQRIRSPQVVRHRLLVGRRLGISQGIRSYFRPTL
jgi:hypothetical protein